MTYLGYSNHNWGDPATTYNIAGLITMPGTPPNAGLTPDTYFSIDNVMYVTTGGYSLSNAGIGFYSDAPSYYSNNPPAGLQSICGEMTRRPTRLRRPLLSTSTPCSMGPPR